MPYVNIVGLTYTLQDVLYLQDLVYEDSGSDTSDSAHSFNQINSELLFFILKLQGTLVSFKGTVSRDGFCFWEHAWSILGLNRERG